MKGEKFVVKKGNGYLCNKIQITMKQKLILLCLFLMCSFAMMGQNPNTTGTITRQRKHTQQQTTTTQGSGTAKKKKTTTQQSQSRRQNTQQTQQQTVSATPTAYDVTFSCNVPTATLYIDGNNYGTPSGTRTLKTGNHSIRLTAEGYEDYQTTISVSGSSHSYSFEMKKKAPVTSFTRSGDNIIFTVKDISFTMVYVEGGTFTMGATSEQGKDAYKDEKPTHSVTLSSYYMGETEVTQALWEAVMGSPASYNGGWTSEYGVGNNYPAYRVSWEDCQTFINRLNSLTGQQFHLPTEAQWEYAARGGSKSRGYKYSGSSDVGSVAWYDGNGSSTTHPIKTKSPNELGLYDMSGNVWEWCSDWYGSYSSGSQTNPTGASSVSYRVFRGGSWFNNARNCRVSYRRYSAPSGRSYNIGLRLAL